MVKGFKSDLVEQARAVDGYLQGCLQMDYFPPELRKAMEYSLLAGGKRIRPVLCLAWAQMLGASRDEVLPFAAALELVHTYSLIHDDLPAMDNDDLRRGLPTSHKVFGEAVAILAGDALLTQAFSMMLGCSLPDNKLIAASREVADAAGPGGMVGGQCLDVMATGKGDMDLEALKKMHSMKTGALIRASCKSGAILASHGQNTPTNIQNASEYGTYIGLAFQIVDDILDVTGDEKSLGKPAGSDESGNKSTYPRFLGLEKSRKLAQESADTAKYRLKNYHGQQKKFLENLAQYIVDRAC